MGKRGPQPEQTARLHVMVSPELLARIDVYADENGLNRSQAIRKLVGSSLNLLETALEEKKCPAETA